MFDALMLGVQQAVEDVLLDIGDLARRVNELKDSSAEYGCELHEVVEYLLAAGHAAEFCRFGGATACHRPTVSGSGATLITARFGVSDTHKKSE